MSSPDLIKLHGDIKSLERTTDLLHDMIKQLTLRIQKLEAPDPVTPPTPEGTPDLSQATPEALDLELDSLFDLIERKIPDHHLKPKFIADCKIAIKNKIVDELQEAKKWATKADTADQVWQQLDDRIAELNKLVGDQNG